MNNISADATRVTAPPALHWACDSPALPLLAVVPPSRIEPFLFSVDLVSSAGKPTGGWAGWSGGRGLMTIPRDGFFRFSGGAKWRQAYVRVRVQHHDFGFGEHGGAVCKRRGAAQRNRDRMRRVLEPSACRVLGRRHRHHRRGWVRRVNSRGGVGRAQKTVSPIRCRLDAGHAEWPFVQRSGVPAMQAAFQGSRARARQDISGRSRWAVAACPRSATPPRGKQRPRL